MWGKVLGGIVLGVGAVAAAPFTGGGSIFAATTLASSLAGGATVAAAVGAGAVGGAAGAMIASSEEDEVQEKMDRQKAKYELEKEKLMKSLDGIMKDTTNVYEFIIAMHAVGISVAYVDGNFSEEEKEQIADFVSGLSNSYLPENVKKQLKELAENPPSVTTAFEYASKLGLTEKGWADLDDLIELVIMADNYEDEKETAFRNAWATLKKSA